MRTLAILAWAAALAVAAPAFAQGPLQLEPIPSGAGILPPEQMPDDFKDVVLADKLGAQVPLDAKLLDQNGRACTLAEKFAGGIPVILTLNYFDCPMLCKLELNGLVESLRQAEPTLGKECRVVTVSIDPRDNPAKAKNAQELYLKEYDRPAGGERPWEFLVGPEAEVRKIADAVGFGYKWIPKQRDYAHHAAVFVCAPDGKLCRVLTGIKYEPNTLRLAILEASQGEVGTLDQVRLLCFQWDPHTGKYGLAMPVMRIGAGAVALTLAGTIAWLLRRDQRVRRPAGNPADAAGDGTGGRA